eukprot:5804591-Prymnesium_polylepis.1
MADARHERVSRERVPSLAGQDLGAARLGRNARIPRWQSCTTRCAVWCGLALPPVGRLSACCCAGWQSSCASGFGGGRVWRCAPPQLVARQHAVARLAGERAVEHVNQVDGELVRAEHSLHVELRGRRMGR